MIKYTRKQINQQVDRFRKSEFVLYEDVLCVMEVLVQAALDAGADQDKLSELSKAKITVN